MTELERLFIIHLATLYMMTPSTAHEKAKETGVTIHKGNPIKVRTKGITTPALNISTILFFDMIFTNT